MTGFVAVVYAAASAGGEVSRGGLALALLAGSHRHRAIRDRLAAHATAGTALGAEHGDRPLGPRRDRGRAHRQRRRRSPAGLRRRPRPGVLRGAARHPRDHAHRPPRRPLITWGAMLASIDGAIGPAEEARIPVSDEGLLRGDGAFEVMRLYQGRPFALEDHLARLARTCAGLRLELDLDTWRTEITALLERSGPDRGPAAARADPRRPPDRPDRAAAAPQGDRSRRNDPLRAQPRPGRPQDAVLRRQHARDPPGEGGRLRRSAARLPARPRAGGTDVVVLLGPRRPAAARRRWRTGSSARSPASGSWPRRTRPRRSARSTTCRPRRRRSSPRPCAWCSRSPPSTS